MKELKYKELIAYTAAFVSFILPKIDVDEVILFGSVARREADKKSDIDLFFNIRAQETGIKAAINKELNKFYKSYIYESWKAKGITNPIKIEVGNLDKWKLKRSIISDGIVLYGKYKSVPEKLKAFTLFNISPIKDIAKRNKVIRLLFGRIEKDYSTPGILERLEGKKLTSNSFIVPLGKANEIIGVLNSEKINFSFFEFWSDQLL